MRSVCCFEVLFHLPPLYVIGVKIPNTRLIVSTNNLKQQYDRKGLTVALRRELPDIGIYRRFRFYVRNFAKSAILNIAFMTIVGNPDEVSEGEITYINGRIRATYDLNTTTTPKATTTTSNPPLKIRELLIAREVLEAKELIKPENNEKPETKE
ncbi:unnamed protein product [Gordionus sp. m RMFG-2023]